MDLMDLLGGSSMIMMVKKAKEMTSPYETTFVHNKTKCGCCQGIWCKKISTTLWHIRGFPHDHTHFPLIHVCWWHARVCDLGIQEYVNSDEVK